MVLLDLSIESGLKVLYKSGTFEKWYFLGTFFRLKTAVTSR
jgi:hypothetical protein